MVREDKVATKEAPLVIDKGGIHEYGTITIKAGGTIQIADNAGNVIIRAEKIIKE